MTPEEREYEEIGAAIQGMLAAVVLLRRNGYDPVEVAKMIDDDDLMERVCGRRPRFEDKLRQRDYDKYQELFGRGEGDGYSDG